MQLNVFNMKLNCLVRSNIQTFRMPTTPLANKGQKTTNEVAAKYGVHPEQIVQ